MIINGGEGGDLLKSFQGSPCFWPWLLLGIMHFVGFGGVAGSGGVWVEGEACLVCNNEEVEFGCKFGQI